MRVEFEPPIYDRLREAINGARIANRTIKRVVLTHEEADEFRAWANTQALTLDPRIERTTKFLGVTIEVEPR